VHVLGIDPSLTHTAICHHHGMTVSHGSIKSKPADHIHDIARLDWLGEQLEIKLNQCSGEHEERLAIIEGYAFGAKCSREALGELGGQYRLVLYRLGWKIIIVPPTSLKMFVCGKGNAPKEQVMMQVFKRWGYEAPDNNAADAYALMRLGMAWSCP